MRVLVFGGAGFIGANLVEFLMSQARHEVFVFDNLSQGNQLEFLVDMPTLIVGDMMDAPLVARTLHEIQPQVIYHLAANSDVQASSSDSMPDIRDTLSSTVVLANELAKSNQKRQLIFASSSAVYGDQIGQIKEDSRTKPVSSYGWMKLASEAVLELLAVSGGVEKLLIARFPNVTGRYMTHGVVSDLVSQLKLLPKELRVLGDGTQDKPFVLASELVRELSRVSEMSTDTVTKLNFSPKDTISVKEIAELILNESGHSAKIAFGESPIGWPGDVNKYQLSTEKIEELFGNLDFGTSENAIRVSTRWALEQLR
jgi:UDP-glucose 4-epimerase